MRPHGVRDLAAAIERNPTLARDAAAGDVRGAARAMAEEARVRADPQLRAERFMERWRVLEAENGGAGSGTVARADMIAGLRHDPALRAELERRAPELGLDRDRQQTPEQVLQRQIEMERSPRPPAGSRAGSVMRSVRQGGKALAVLRYGMLTAILAAVGLASAGLLLFTLSMLVDLVRGRG